MKEQMDYTCDAGLGAPTEVDCALLEYEQLRGSSDTLSVGPGTPKVLSSSEFLFLKKSPLAVVSRDINC